jgi:CubicO group peptidase (beta-lactamase class C family)
VNARTRSGAALATLVLILIPAHAIASASSSPIASARSSRNAGVVRSIDSAAIDKFVAERMAVWRIPGASVAVVRGGTTIHLAGYGVADPSGRAVTPDTPFLIGSVSKPLTAIAIQQLVHDGRLRLDDPVSPYLANVTGEDPAVLAGVTVEHLLTHTSGLANRLGLPGSEVVRSGPDALRLRIIDLVAHHTRVRASGAAYEYSNANYVLLAGIVEQVSGMPFAQYMRERVFDPLDMNATFATDQDPRAATLARGHESWFGTWRPSNEPYDPAAAANGYMGSTARDLATLMAAELGPASIDDLPVRATDVAARPATPTNWDIPLERNVTSGWFMDELGGQKTVSHTGSLGDFTTHVILVPGTDRLGIAVQTNASAFIAAGHAGQYDISLGLVHHLLGLGATRSEPSPWTLVVAPMVAWGLGLLTVGLAARHLRSVRSGSLRPRRPGLRAVVTSLAAPSGFLGLAAVIFVVTPSVVGVSLGSARIFYPDVAWGLTVTGGLALGWGLVRMLLALREAAKDRRSVAAGADVVSAQ